MAAEVSTLLRLTILGLFALLVGACSSGGTGPAAAPLCCEGRGSCMDGASLGEQASLLSTLECEDARVCVPQGFETEQAPARCEASLAGSEGRCLSPCLSIVAERAGQLKQDDCEGGALCLPCVDPITGEDTGACALFGDSGPTEDAETLPSCCGAAGRCVLPSSAPKGMKLSADTCEAGLVCAPEAALQQGDAFVPTSCTTALRGEGRCLPPCLPLLADQLPLLAQNDCDAGLVCAPCLDPASGDATGACDLGADPGPGGTGLRFPECCGGVAHCVPQLFVPGGQQDQLLQDTCGAGNLCVPDAFAAENFVPLSCNVSGWDAEGRCLPRCVAPLQDQLERLAQDGCPDEHLCAPCYDPFTGEPTGSCEVGGDEGPNEDPATFDTCCGGVAHCVPAAFVPEAQRDALTPLTCGEADLCVPDAFVDETFAPATCTASKLNDAEGRCLPACLSSVSALGDQLAQDGCEEGERCAPCFDPRTGDATGACELVADPGPTEPPAVFARCCEDGGQCIPTALVPEGSRESLSPLTCGEANLCVPDAFVDTEHVPATCHASKLNGAEGRCLPACLSAVAAQAERLAQDDCAAGELCAPCYDPVSGEATGSCSQLSDPGPAEPPTVFADCCSEAGHCVPDGLVPDSVESSLAPLSCTQPGDLCVPDPFMDAAYVPATCRASQLNDAEGRCLPACLPAIAGQADRLAQDGCAAGELCAPCYDPTTGAATGSCNVGADPGPSDPPAAFAECCGGAGHCVPDGLVPEGSRSSLAPLSCTQAGDLCVPDPFLDAAYVPRSCAAGDYGAEGRCLPSCLPQLAGNQARLTRGVCDAGELCAPCYDPLSGAATGACDLAADPGPAQPPVVFPGCCGGDGTCVPDSFVPDAQRDQLGTDSCSAAGDLCVPSPLLASNYVPASCVVSAVGAEGRCLPACLPAVAAQAQVLQQDGCPATERCAPCFDPITGSATGVCAFAGDPGPAQPPVTLPGCCNGLGMCAPDAWVPASQASLLGQDTCAGQTDLCVAPRALASDPQYVPTTCRDWRTNGEGRCLPSCLPSVAAQSSALIRGPCPTYQLCVPCFDPIDGAATGACTVGADPGPASPPTTFERCCGSGATAEGLCVPDSFLPAGSPSLSAQSCSGSTDSCVPLGIASGQPLPTCDTLTEPGVCLDSCFLDVFQSLLLTRDVCQSGQRCVPCSAIGDGTPGCG